MELQLFKILSPKSQESRVTLLNLTKLEVEDIIRNLGWMIELVVLEDYYIIDPSDEEDFDQNNSEENYEEIILTLRLSDENKYIYSTLRDKYKIIKILSNTINALSSMNLL